MYISIKHVLNMYLGPLMAQMVKNVPAIQETQV